MTIRTISADELPQYLGSLVQLLQDAVDSGASVGFLPPLAPAVATDFWTGVADALRTGHRLLWIAEQDGRTLVLDTLQGEPSELLYQQLGYTAAGAIPAFARVASGALEPTVVYYKLLA